MKNPIIYLFMAALFVQCSADQEMEDQSADQVLMYEQDLDLSNQMPRAALDATNKGLYVGTLVTTDLSFHEKIFINVENDGHINAQIPLASGKTHVLRGSKQAKDADVYQFTGDIGHFTVSIFNNEATITDAILDNKAAVINVIKSTSTYRGVPSLGTFSNGDGSLSGTWDFTWTQITPDLFESVTLSIVKNGGNTYSPSIPAATYQRYCGKGTFFQITSESNANTTILDMPLTFSVNGGYLENQNNCDPAPFQYDDFSDPFIWDWNSKDGYMNIDTFSLPWFN